MYTLFAFPKKESVTELTLTGFWGACTMNLTEEKCVHKFGWNYFGSVVKGRILILSSIN
jgi:hypothetical protein